VGRLYYILLKRRILLKGFSPLKSKWLSLLLVSTIFLLILPIIAGAQPEGEGVTEEATEAVEGGEDVAAEELLEATDTEIPPVEPEPVVIPPVPVTEAKFHYFILHSLYPDAPINEWEVVDRFPANESYTYEEPGYFGFFLEPPKDEDGYKEHYYRYENNVPNFIRKKAVYRVEISQPLKAAPPPPAPVEEPAMAEEIVPGEGTMTDTPPDITTPPPPDLVKPEGYMVRDCINDQGGVIAITWPAVESDMLEHTYTPDPEPLPPPPAVKGPEEKPEYQLNVLNVDAWLYYDDLDTPEFPYEENDPADFKVTVNLTRLDDDEKFKEAELNFVEFTPDGLGMHFANSFTFSKDEPAPGTGLLRIKAMAPDGKLRKGKITYKKGLSLPISNVRTEDPLPDNRYTHYFKIGMDYSNREGMPRWILETTPIEGVIATENWFNTAKWNSLLYGVLITCAILFFIFSARKGKELFVRRIAGLDHVEEAIGRATEMGKPILYVPGLGYMSDVATIAATNILGQVARKVASYDSQVLVPCRDAIVMTVCQEVVQEAYIDAGHPDAYNKDNVFFLTDDQFSYTAAVDGIMVRDKPATNFFMGMFYAESLILAETGAGTGAIQIAGTDALAQLPFFITACDYTLIGEELYAASAYLSREPLLLGSLKGQDLAKLVFMIMIVFGVILATVGIPFLAKLFSSPL
jgi:hypothetical protein